MLDSFELLVAVLATWRISAALYYGKEFEPLRDRLTFALDDDDVPLSWWGRQISCFWCVSFLVALVVWPVALWASWVLWPFAVSGAVVLLSWGGRTVWREGMQ